MKKLSNAKVIREIVKELSSDENTSFESRVTTLAIKHLLKREKQTKRKVKALVEAVNRLAEARALPIEN